MGVWSQDNIGVGGDIQAGEDILGHLPSWGGSYPGGNILLHRPVTVAGSFWCTTGTKKKIELLNMWLNQVRYFRIKNGRILHTILCLLLPLHNILIWVSSNAITIVETC